MAPLSIPYLDVFKVSFLAVSLAAPSLLLVKFLAKSLVRISVGSSWDLADRISL